MSTTGGVDRSAGLGIEALELFVEVLSQSEQSSAPGEGFYDRLCEAVCRLAHMRRAVIFRYDAATRRVRAAGAHRLDIEQFATAHVTVESASFAARALAEDRVVEIDGDVTGEIPAEYVALFPEPVRLVCAPMVAADRAIGVILADRLLAAPPLDDAEVYLLWTLGKAAALASVSRIVATQAEKAQQLEQRIDLAREIHEGVIQRLFGVSMALDGDGDLPAAARERCASETQRALSDLRIALQRPLGRAPRATRTTFVAEVERLSRVHPELGVTSKRGRQGDVPDEPRAARAVRARRGGAQRAQARQPQPCERAGRARRRGVRARGGQRRRPRPQAPGRGWGCGSLRSRRCRAAGSSSSGSRSPAAGRCGWWCPAMAEQLRKPRAPAVLVVDDHDVVHWGFRLMLTQQPWVERCVSAHSGPRAIELRVRYRPHVALVDLFLGEESGAGDLSSGPAPPSRARGCCCSRAPARSRPSAARAAGASGSPTRTGRRGGSPSAVRLVGLGGTVFERHDRPEMMGSPIASARCSS